MRHFCKMLPPCWSRHMQGNRQPFRQPYRTCMTDREADISCYVALFTAPLGSMYRAWPSASLRGLPHLPGGTEQDTRRPCTIWLTARNPAQHANGGIDGKSRASPGVMGDGIGRWPATSWSDLSTEAIPPCKRPRACLPSFSCFGHFVLPSSPARSSSPTLRPPHLDLLLCCVKRTVDERPQTPATKDTWQKRLCGLPSSTQSSIKLKSGCCMVARTKSSDLQYSSWHPLCQADGFSDSHHSHLAAIRFQSQGGLNLSSAKKPAAHSQ
ncbi:hypothetical protein F5Y07DRAFT_372194 [Xylaria sp. FL0933]|nr:hypothetical protein F5Y07DRAFT_372194 [Xylaria sp. FL0933]